MNELRQIVEPVAKRWDGDDGDGEAEEEVLAELPRRDVRPEIAVRRGDDPDVDPTLGLAAHPPHFPALERAQEAGLKIDRKLAYLVEKERPAVGALERAGVGRDGPREGSALVAQKLALGEVGRHGAAIEDDERAARAGALLVQRVGDDVLAGSGLAEQRDGDLGLGEPLDHIEHFEHRSRPRRERAELPHRPEMPTAEVRRRQLRPRRRPAPTRHLLVRSEHPFALRGLVGYGGRRHLPARTLALDRVGDVHHRGFDSVARVYNRSRDDATRVVLPTSTTRSGHRPCYFYETILGRPRADAPEPRTTREDKTSQLLRHDARRQARPRDPVFMRRPRRAFACYAPGRHLSKWHCLYQRMSGLIVKLGRRSRLLRVQLRHRLHGIVMKWPKFGIWTSGNRTPGPIVRAAHAQSPGAARARALPKERGAAKPPSRKERRGGITRKDARAEEFWDSPGGEELATERTTPARLTPSSGERERRTTFRPSCDPLSSLGGFAAWRPSLFSPVASLRWGPLEPEGNANGSTSESDEQWARDRRSFGRRPLREGELGHAPSTSLGRTDARLGSRADARARSPPSTQSLASRGGCCRSPCTSPTAPASSRTTTITRRPSPGGGPTRSSRRGYRSSTDIRCSPGSRLTTKITTSS